MIFYSAKISKIITKYNPTPNISNEVYKSAAFQQEMLKMCAKEQAGKVFNGLSLMVNGVEFSEYGEEIVLELSQVDYFTSQALSAHNGSKSAEIKDFRNHPTGNFGACTFLISNDSKVLTAKRSDRCDSYPGMRAFCFGEGANYEDLKDLRLISTRCLHEELDLNITLDFVKVSGLFFDDYRKTWGIASLVDLSGKGKQFDSENLIRISKNAEDSWENEDLKALSISHCKSLLKFSKDHYPLNKLITFIN